MDVQKGQTMARKKVKITISRGDLGARYECRAQNDALETPLVSYVDLDVYGEQEVFLSAILSYLQFFRLIVMFKTTYWMFAYRGTT